MFFRKDYGSPGPGIDRDEPEKTGVPGGDFIH